MTTRTKIVVTIGPASDNMKTLTALLKAGMHIVRFNFSHNTTAWHIASITHVRNAAAKLERSIAIMADLQGPCIREGTSKRMKEREAPYLSEKDKLDIQAALSVGVNLFALSFVRTAQDIKDARTWIQQECQGSVGLIAKIECKDAVDHIKEILEEADGIMVARGDLGVEIPQEQVPVVQKDVVALCRQKGVPVIVATQMMESMIHSPTPTRAEVSDVANAVIDHADAVMLSGETAQGEYPVEVVSEMQKIIAHTERSRYDDLYSRQQALELVSGISKGTPSVQGILVVHPGDIWASRAVSRIRPELPIFVPCSTPLMQDILALSWGVVPLQLSDTIPATQLVSQSLGFIHTQGWLKAGEKLMLVHPQEPSRVVSLSV